MSLLGRPHPAEPNATARAYRGLGTLTDRPRLLVASCFDRLGKSLPLRAADRPAHLTWATEAFRLTTGGVRPDPQIHTHVDADVISPEAARSRMQVAREPAAHGHPCGPASLPAGPGSAPAAAARQTVRERLAVMACDDIGRPPCNWKSS